MALFNRCRRVSRFALFLLCVTGLTLWLLKTVFLTSYSLLLSYNPFFGDSYCREHWLNHYVRQMCFNYSRKLILGEFCEDICYDSDITVNSCFVHHGETTVIDMSINDKPMILKMKEEDKEVEFEVMDQLNKIWEHWLSEHEFPILLLKQFIIDHFQRYLGLDSKVIDKTRGKQIVDAIIPDKIERLSEEQLHSIYYFLRGDGILPLIYYQDLLHSLKYYGNCGPLYAVERLTPLSAFFPAMHPSLTWTKRAVIAISFLDFMKEIQLADGGPLHICDFKESDFGVTSSYQIKLIDYGMLFTNERVKELVSQGTCENDKGCEFFDCRATCSSKIKKCTSTLKTNNIQMLCRRIFRQDWPLKGLLTDIPSRLQTVLNPMIDQCSSARFGYLHSNSSEVQSLLLDMRDLLAKDLATLNW